MNHLGEHPARDVAQTGTERIHVEPHAGVEPAADNAKGVAGVVVQQHVSILRRKLRVGEGGAEIGDDGLLTGAPEILFKNVAADGVVELYTELYVIPYILLNSDTQSDK